MAAPPTKRVGGKNTFGWVSAILLAALVLVLILIILLQPKTGSERVEMKKMPKTPNPAVLLTDFRDDRQWSSIRNEIVRPSEEGFVAHVEFVADRAFEDIDPEQLLQLIPEGYGHTFIMVVDRVTLSSPEHPVLVIDLSDEPGRSFRSIPGQIQGIENNLSIFNMSFDEFANAADDDGVFRGFEQG